MLRPAASSVPTGRFAAGREFGSRELRNLSNHRQTQLLLDLFTGMKAVVAKLNQHGQHASQKHSRKGGNRQDDATSGADLHTQPWRGNDGSLEAAIVLDQTGLLQTIDDHVIQAPRFFRYRGGNSCPSTGRCCALWRRHVHACKDRPAVLLRSPGS